MFMHLTSTLVSQLFIPTPRSARFHFVQNFNIVHKKKNTKLVTSAFANNCLKTNTSTDLPKSTKFKRKIHTFFFKFLSQKIAEVPHFNGLLARV